MKPRVLALLFALSCASAFWLSSATSPSHAPAPDPVEDALPPEAFAQLDLDDVEVRNGSFQVWLYNGSEYSLQGLEYEVELTDFPWQGNEHNSRMWRLRSGAVRHGSVSPLAVSLWECSLGFEVNPEDVKVKVTGAWGHRS